MCALLCNPLLFGGQGYAGYGYVEILCEKKPHPPPATTDIEDMLTFIEQQLCRDMTFLGFLGFFEACVGVLEIGAGILQVIIQKEAKQPFVEIVMVCDIALCSFTGNTASRQKRSSIRQKVMATAGAVTKFLAPLDLTICRKISSSSASITMRPSMYISANLSAGSR